MADEEEGQAAAETAADEQGPGKRKLLLAGGIAAVLVIAMGIGAYFFLMSNGKDADEPGTIDQHSVSQQDEIPEGFDDEDEFDEDEEPLGAIFPLETFIVNLAGAQKFMRLQVQLEFAERSVPKRYQLRQVPIRDGLIKLLTARTVEELVNQEGKENLKEDIKDMINQYLRREEVKRVYFTQFVIQ